MEAFDVVPQTDAQRKSDFCNGFGDLIPLAIFIRSKLSETEKQRRDVCFCKAMKVLFNNEYRIFVTVPPATKTARETAPQIFVSMSRITQDYLL